MNNYTTIYTINNIKKNVQKIPLKNNKKNLD